MRFTICAAVASLLGGLESTTASSLLAQQDSQLALTESFLGGDELLQLDADAEYDFMKHLRSEGQQLAVATQAFTLEVVEQSKIWKEMKKDHDYNGKKHLYCDKENPENKEALNKESYQLEKKLNSKLEDLLDARNDLAASIDMPKAHLLTKKELAAKLAEKPSDQTDTSSNVLAQQKLKASTEQVNEGLKKGLAIFDERIKKDFKEDPETKQWKLKDELDGNSRFDGSRKAKIDSMTVAMNYWSGSWTDKDISIWHSPTRYQGTQVFARGLIEASCEQHGNEEQSTDDMFMDVLSYFQWHPFVAIGLGINELIKSF